MHYGGHNKSIYENQNPSKSKCFLFSTGNAGCPVLAMSQTNAKTTRQKVTHVHPANLLSLDNTLDQLIQGVQAKLRTNDHSVSDPQQSQTKLSAANSRYSPFAKSLDSYQQRSDLPGTDLWRNKVKLREATMHREDLLDPELVQMQTFKKARPQSGWASILLNAAIRAMFLPILYSWWRFELTKPQYFMLLTSWLLAAWNLNCYFDSEFRVNNQNGTTQMIFDIELLGPALYLFLLSFTYCHIHNARNRASLATSQQGMSGSPREKHENNFQRHLTKRSSESNNSTSHNTAQTTAGGTSTSRLTASRVGSTSGVTREDVPTFRVASMRIRNEDAFDMSRLTPIEDVEAVDIESANQFERNSVSSQEEHQHFPESVVPSRESDGRNASEDVFQSNGRYPSEERFDQDNFNSLSHEYLNANMALGLLTSQGHDFRSHCNVESLRNVENQNDSGMVSPLFVATHSSSVNVGVPMPSVANLIKQLTERDQRSSQSSLKAQNEQNNAASNEGVEYLEAMIASSAPISNNIPRNGSEVQDQLENNFSANSSNLEPASSSGIIPSEHQNPSRRKSDIQHTRNAADQVEAGSSILLDSLDPTSTDLNSQSPPWSSNPVSTLQSSNESWTSKSKVSSSNNSDSKSASGYTRSLCSKSTTETFYKNLSRPLHVDIAGNDTAHMQVSSGLSDSKQNISTQRTNSNFSASFIPEEESSATIPCKVSGIRKEKLNKLTRKSSRKTSTSSSGTGKGCMGRLKRVPVSGSSTGRASFLPKRVVCYLKELEKAAEKASAKSNTAQLTWQEVILRFLMNCRLWFCTFCGILKQKLLFITGRRSQSFGCAEGCHHTSDSSLPNRKSSSGSSRGRRSRDEQELESDEDEDNANISDVSEEEAEETAGSSIEETEDYVHRQAYLSTPREASTAPTAGSMDTSSHVDQNHGITSTPGITGSNNCNQIQMNNSGNPCTTNVAGSEKTVTIITWNQLGKCSKADLTAEQVCDLIVNRADSIRNSNFYLMLGTLCAIFISCIPYLYRYYSMPGYRLFSDLYQLMNLSDVDGFTSSCLIRDRTYLTYFSLISSFLICVIFFLLLATAERTYLQRYYYSKYLYRLTSSKKARKCEIPHFRLTKVRNIKMWLHIRFKLKAHGSQKTVEAIVSSCLLFCILSISLISFKLLEDIQMSSSQSSSKGGRVASALSPGSPTGSPGQQQSTSSSMGTSEQDQLVFIIRSNSHITSWIAISWCLTLGFFLLRYITIGTKVNKKYSNTAMLTTERINLSLRMETKPEKREEYILADRVLKLACRLIAEVESPFKVSGLVMNSALYNLMRVILLSALSAAFSEMLGFNPKLWKI